MRSSLPALVACALGASVATGQTVTLSLTSPQAGQNVAPGTTINWTISVSVPVSGSAGLALVATDLVPDAANPVKFDIPPGNAASIDATMSQFSRPAGISNPGEGSATTGYIGVQRGTAGQKYLKQIGGAQNTFGVPGTAIGLDFNVASGVGQSGARTVLSGSFVAPATAGAYTFRLANAMANVLNSVGTPPSYSPVHAATVDATTSGSFLFTVVPGSLGDMNCDNTFNTADVTAFVLALVNPTLYTSTYPGCNPLRGDFFDDDILNGKDIKGFVAALLGS